MNQGIKSSLNKIRLWSMHWAATKWGAWALFLFAFADASFLPLPTPMFFITLTLLNITKAYRYALFATTGILLGSITGYSIGYFAWLNANGEFTGLAQYMFNTVPGFSEAVYKNIHVEFEKWDFGILFVASFLPVPFNLFSISSGVFGINLLMFCISTLIGQGIRFYLMAFLIVKLGPKVKKLLELKLKPVAILATIIIALAIVALKIF